MGKIKYKRGVIILLASLIIFSGIVLAGSCSVNPALPTEKVTVFPTHPGSSAYWNVAVSNVFGIYDVTNATYPGWCADEYHYLYPNKYYNATLYSSYDPNLAVKCPRCFDEDWAKINYIINHKQGDIVDVQNAIWYFMDGGVYPSDADARAMVNEANSSGEDFCPQLGEQLAIITYINDSIQLIFLEITHEVENCEPNVTIYQDATQRSWFPNDQTVYVAEEYGTLTTNLYGDKTYQLPARGNYVFNGETLAFYVIVEDEDGVGDIDTVVLDKFGGCVDKAVPTNSAVATFTSSKFTTWEAYAEAKFGITSWNPATMKLYKCKLIVGSETGEQQLRVDVEDESNCVVTDTKEYIDFNPSIAVSVNGAISFGSVTPGSVATSLDPLKLANDGETVLDMYIASDDYFKDPINKNTTCGDEGNGIKYDQFSYYATKGSVNSGSNNNVWPGLGDYSGDCQARADEYTPMPSHSGDIQDMCRVINHLETGSFLSPGDYMSLTFRLDVPTPCEGSFTDGQFHFVGRVI